MSAYEFVKLPAAILLFSLLGACGGSGGGTTSNGSPSLSTSAAISIIDDYLDNTEADVVVFAEINPTATDYRCTVLGVYPANGRKICVIYSATAPPQSGSPIVSKATDYVLHVQTGDEEAIRARMASLDIDMFRPVLEERVDLGNLPADSSLPAGTIRVRGSEAGIANNCEIRSTQLAREFSLEANGNGYFSIPTNSSFNLSPGSYAIHCTFTVSGEVALNVLTHWFQVLSPQNTAPVVTNVHVVDSGIEKTSFGAIRDINQQITVTADGFSDAEDGTNLQIEPYVLLDGIALTPPSLSGNEYTIDISEYGGKLLTVGFRVRDSMGATTTSWIGLSIDVNNQPAYVGGLSDLLCVPGGTLALPLPVFDDADDDSLTISYTIGSAGIFICDQEGDFQYSAQATDPWGSQGTSPVFNINVSATNNRPPIITRGGFVNGTCVFYSLSCYEPITLPSCSDPDGNLADLPVVYDGNEYNGAYASGQSIGELYLSPGRYVLKAYCVDETGLRSEELQAVVDACIYSPYTCF